MIRSGNPHLILRAQKGFVFFQIIKSQIFSEQECIPVGCVPHARWPYPVVSEEGSAQPPGCRPPQMETTPTLDADPPGCRPPPPPWTGWLTDRCKSITFTNFVWLILWTKLCNVMMWRDLEDWKLLPCRIALIWKVCVRLQRAECFRYSSTAVYRNGHAIWLRLHQLWSKVKQWRIGKTSGTAVGNIFKWKSIEPTWHSLYVHVAWHAYLAFRSVLYCGNISA